MIADHAELLLEMCQEVDATRRHKSLLEIAVAANKLDIAIKNHTTLLAGGNGAHAGTARAYEQIRTRRHQSAVIK